MKNLIENYFESTSLKASELLGLEIQWRMRRVGEWQKQINPLERPVYYTEATRKRENLIARRNSEINNLLKVLEKEFSFVNLPYMRFTQEDTTKLKLFMNRFAPVWNKLLEEKRRTA